MAERSGQDFPSVYDYEVSSEFGTWFGKFILEHRRAPSQDKANAELKRRVDAFFAQGKDAPPASCVPLSIAATIKALAQNVSYEDMPAAMEKIAALCESAEQQLANLQHDVSRQIASSTRKFVLFDHASAMYVTNQGALESEPHEFASANDAMHAGLSVLSENGYQAGEALEIRELTREADDSPRAPSKSEIELIVDLAPNADPDEMREALERGRIAVLDRYVSDGPGYTGRVAVIVYSGGPDLFDVFTLDGPNAGPAAPSVRDCAGRPA